LTQRFIDFSGIFRVIYVLHVLMVNGKGKVHSRKGHEGLGAGGG